MGREAKVWYGDIEDELLCEGVLDCDRIRFDGRITDQGIVGHFQLRRLASGSSPWFAEASPETVQDVFYILGHMVLPCDTVQYLDVHTGHRRAWGGGVPVPSGGCSGSNAL